MALHILTNTRDILVAFPVDQVLAVLRRTPMARVGEAPAFVLGVATLRSRPVPVVDTAQLLGGEPGPAGRLVLLTVGEELVAMQVGAVSGFVTLEGEDLAAAPPLLEDAATGAIAALTRRDPALAVVLDAARIVPPEVWCLLPARDS